MALEEFLVLRKRQKPKYGTQDIEMITVRNLRRENVWGMRMKIFVFVHSVICRLIQMARQFVFLFVENASSRLTYSVLMLQCESCLGQPENKWVSIVYLWTNLLVHIPYIIYHYIPYTLYHHHCKPARDTALKCIEIFCFIFQFCLMTFLFFFLFF